MFRTYRDITRDVLREPKLPRASNIEYYTCDYCSDEYLSETEVEIHKRIQHKDIITLMILDPKRIICKLCFHECTTRELLLKHLKVEHLFSADDAQRIEREVFICDICDQIFFNKQMLAVHILHNHKSIVKKNSHVQCPKCTKMIRTATVWYHFQYHEIQSVACCPICLKKCKNRADLKVHMKTHPSHLYCDICAYQGKKTLNLKDHIDRHHNRHSNSELDDSIVKRCFIPKKSMYFKVQSHWGIWRGTNLQEGVYICILCREIISESVRVGTKLKEHIKRVHVVEKQEEKRISYVCTCGEFFFNKILLKHHVFKLKGDHRAADDNNTAQSAVSSDNNEELVALEAPLPEVDLH